MTPAERRREYMRQYNQRPEVQERQRARAAARTPEERAKHVAGTKRWHLQKRYGLTEESRAALLELQGGCCAVCKTQVAFTGAGFAHKAHVDHCHQTGRVRGVLCARCNTAIGALGDSVDSLKAVVRYLEGHGTQT